MKYAFLGLIVLFLCLALLFNFGSYYDYSYDGSYYGVDFNTPTDINSSMIQYSFDTVYSASSSVMHILRGILDLIVTNENHFEGVFSDDSGKLIIKLMVYTDYVDEKYSGFLNTINRWRYRNECLKYAYQIDDEEPEFYQEDGWQDYALEHFGWTYDLQMQIHTYFLDNNIAHWFDHEYFE